MTTPPKRELNGRLIAVVAAIAVAAVAVGGALAYRQRPEAAASTLAAPLGGTPSPTPSPAPSPTPMLTSTPVVLPKPTPTPKPSLTQKSSMTPEAPSGPVALEAAKLTQGKSPQLTYWVHRTVLGAGKELKVPVSASLMSVVRLGSSVLATSAGGELLKVDSAGAVVRRTPQVMTLTGTADQTAAAYAATPPVVVGEQTYGATLYSETGGSQQSVKLPDVQSIHVLAYAKDKIYYKANVKGALTTMKLYSWTPGAAKPVLMKTVAGDVMAVSDDGRLASTQPWNSSADGCSTVVEIATGKKRFTTCDYHITGFTPDDAVAIGTPAYGDSYCSNIITALDSHSGAVGRQWSGCFYRAVAEDDQHLLMSTVVTGGGQDPNTKTTVVRCSLDTAECERATDVVAANLIDFAR
ncbi:hypothetical protein [Kribbella pratensis]|uniref:Uncharacterized protein n=1 Tax=Kribbella pratensis TaxID=2512112 RepID=A0A4R8C4H1_9ACTN|nr:hypothetical protein [Kribbella pratensis]TDW70749.1 hypothetical protein EV653_4810 [Kribbella pratensis]